MSKEHCYVSIDELYEKGIINHRSKEKLTDKETNKVLGMNITKGFIDGVSNGDKMSDIDRWLNENKKSDEENKRDQKIESPKEVIRIASEDKSYIPFDPDKIPLKNYLYDINTQLTAIQNYLAKILRNMSAGEQVGLVEDNKKLKASVLGVRKD